MSGSPTPERLGRAFTELIQRYPTKDLPKAGGVNATVVVTDDPRLPPRRPHRPPTWTPARPSPPSLARKLACEAGIIPAVLGGKSQVLDLGRKRRFHSEAQRIAKTIEQRRLQRRGLRLATRA